MRHIDNAEINGQALVLSMSIQLYYLNKTIQIFENILFLLLIGCLMFFLTVNITKMHMHFTLEVRFEGEKGPISNLKCKLQQYSRRTHR